jgi:hypothetical protein
LKAIFSIFIKISPKEARSPDRPLEIDHLVNFSHFACIKCRISGGFRLLLDQGFALGQTPIRRFLGKFPPNL